ncbi:MAG: DUF5009 domain-containing protein [Fermentimonas sp.]|nr:DUF5009 domain-containing protein [Fermentimonas sp.]
MRDYDFTKRNTSIDILRALTMVLMIFVNDLWTVNDVPKWMQHANMNEDFLGLADVVFPLFLFVMGMSIPYAIKRRFSKGYSELSTIIHILTRTFALLIMGIFTVNTEIGFSRDMIINRDSFLILMVVGFLLIWNLYPKTDKQIRYLYEVLKIIGVLLLVFLAIVYRDENGEVMQVRWWGILGLIGWAYLVCSLIYLFVRNKISVILAFWVGFVILCLIKSSNIIPRESFINSFINIFQLGTGANVSFTMGGILFSMLLVKYWDLLNYKKILYFVTIALFLFLLAVISNNYWIVSKNEATLPWVLYCLSIAVASYVIIDYLVYIGKASWFTLIKSAGTATLTCYLVPYVLYSLFYGIINASFPGWVISGVPGLIKSAVFAFLCVGITALLEQNKIKIKV